MTLASVFLLPNPEVSVQDALLEGVSIVAFAFILVMAFYARQKNKIFGSRGFPIMVAAITMGLVAAVMDFLTEFLWIETLYDEYKLVMEILFIASLLVFAASLIVSFRFTRFLMGEDED